MIAYRIALPGASRRLGQSGHTMLAATTLMALFLCSCHPSAEQGPAQGAESPQFALQKARSAIGDREETLLAQMLSTAQICEEKAAAQRAVGDIPGAEALEQTALNCYQDAAGAGATISRKRTLAFTGGDAAATIYVRPWDYAQPWEELGPAQGTVSIEKNMMVQFAASPDTLDEHIEALTSFPPGSIQYLNLGEARRLTDASLKAIGRVKGLLDLSLYSTTIGDEGIAALTGLPYLRQVNLMRTQVTSEGVCVLANALPGLVELALEDVQAVDKTLWALRQCPRLERLICKRGNLTDVGVTHLASQQNLQCLWLGGRRITDFSVPLLARLSSLNELVLMDTSIPETGIRALESGLPECRVLIN